MDNVYIRKVLEGDVSGFSYFLDTYKDMAFLIAFRILGNREDAEEIVQDSFLKAFKALSNFKFESKFSTWFYRIVVNTSLSKVKRTKVKQGYDDIDSYSDDRVEHVDVAYKSLIHAEQQKYINTALDKLDTEDRLLLTLYYLNENSIKEIEDITGIPAQNLKMKIHRARKKMYIILEKELKVKLQSLV
jgi:RNA polymerase sigma factor (sigma-70 family)